MTGYYNQIIDDTVLVALNMYIQNRPKSGIDHANDS